MPLSLELQFLHDNEAHYTADPEVVGTRLAGKTLIMVQGPSKIGKTTHITRAIELLPDSKAVPSITDRERKDGDPIDYLTASEGVTRAGLIRNINERRLVNYAIHPAGKIYATELNGYSATYNFLPTLAHEAGIHQLKNAGFEHTYTAYMVTAGERWRSFISHDPFKNAADRRARMEEGIDSLTYAKDHADEIEFIHNGPRHKSPDKAARQLMMVAYGISSPYDKDKALEKIDEMITVAKDLAR